MITEIKLSQIKDTFDGNTDALRLLVASIKKLGHFPFELVFVRKAEEWSEEFQLYLPFEAQSYLVQSAKLAFPSPGDQKNITIHALIYGANCANINQELDTLSIVRQTRFVLSQSPGFISQYAIGIKDRLKTFEGFATFTQLVNSATIEK